LEACQPTDREPRGRAQQSAKVRMTAKKLMEESGLTITAALPDLKFTGERIVPGKTAEALFREHEERYVFAGQYVSGKDVLDVACGSGVGTAFLQSAGARRVSGLDIDPDAIAFAKARYPECEFAQSDATALCLPDASVDVVVSFETLEHLRDQTKFLRECRRALRPNGTLICSTPNRAISRWSAENPFHVREFYPSEFREVLESIFSTVELFGQRDRVYVPYVARKTLRRILERSHVSGRVERLLARKTETEPFRARFVADAASLRENISVYRRGGFLRQPTFLIAVARSTSTNAT
jgi:2-polyprenyl-3-methyl-5-hydroxy-6-metoxy-1,4-benzoquinol methylase